MFARAKPHPGNIVEASSLSVSASYMHAMKQCLTQSSVQALWWQEKGSTLRRFDLSYCSSAVPHMEIVSWPPVVHLSLTCMQCFRFIHKQYMNNGNKKWIGSCDDDDECGQIDLEQICDSFVSSWWRPTRPKHPAVKLLLILLYMSEDQFTLTKQRGSWPLWH